MKLINHFRMRFVLIIVALFVGTQVVRTQSSSMENLYYALISDVEFGNGKYGDQPTVRFTKERVIAKGSSGDRHLISGAQTWEQFWRPFNDLYKEGYRLVQIYTEHRSTYSVYKEMGAGTKFTYEGPAEATTYVFERR